MGEFTVMDFFEILAPRVFGSQNLGPKLAKLWILYYGLTFCGIFSLNQKIAPADLSHVAGLLFAEQSSEKSRVKIELRKICRRRVDCINLLNCCKSQFG